MRYVCRMRQLHTLAYPTLTAADAAFIEGFGRLH